MDLLIDQEASILELSSFRHISGILFESDRAGLDDFWSMNTEDSTLEELNRYSENLKVVLTSSEEKFLDASTFLYKRLCDSCPSVRRLDRAYISVSRFKALSSSSINRKDLLRSSINSIICHPSLFLRLGLCLIWGFRGRGKETPDQDRIHGTTVADGC